MGRGCPGGRVWPGPRRTVPHWLHRVPLPFGPAAARWKCSFVPEAAAEPCSGRYGPGATAPGTPQPGGTALILPRVGCPARIGMPCPGWDPSPAHGTKQTNFWAAGNGPAHPGAQVGPAGVGGSGTAPRAQRGTPGERMLRGLWAPSSSSAAAAAGSGGDRHAGHVRGALARCRPTDALKGALCAQKLRGLAGPRPPPPVAGTPQGRPFWGCSSCRGSALCSGVGLGWEAGGPPPRAGFGCCLGRWARLVLCASSAASPACLVSLACVTSPACLVSPACVASPACPPPKRRGAASPQAGDRRELRGTPSCPQQG